MSFLLDFQSYMTADLMNSLGLVVVSGFLLVAYSLRLALKGRQHYDRVNKQGGSALLGKGMMEIAYWGLQPVGKVFVSLKVTPNMISWLSFIFSGLAGACLAFGHFGFGAAFATIGFLLDSVDGMVARITGVASDAGEVLDAAIDRYSEFFFLFGLAIYYHQSPTLLALTLFALLGCFMVSYSSAKAEALHVDPPKGNMRRPERAFYLTIGALLSPISIPWLEVSSEYSISIGYPMVGSLVLVAVLSNYSAVERLMAIVRQVRAKELAESQIRTKK